MDIEKRSINVFNKFVEEASTENEPARRKLKKIDENADLKSINLGDIGLSSIYFIRVIVALEAEFDIEFEDEEMVSVNYKTMNDVAEFIKTKLNHNC